MGSVPAFAILIATAISGAVSEFIFTAAPFASCHASTIVQLRGGDLMAAWFGGSAEGKSDVAIWSSRRSEGKWSAPEVLVRERDIACFNPVLFHTADGRLWLYYKFGPHPSSWSAGRRWSDNEGGTWSAVEHLPAGLYGPIRAKPLVLSDGAIVSGTSVESYGSWACWIERSTDGGHTWTKFGPVTVPLENLRIPQSEPETESQIAGDRVGTEGIIQPSVVAMGGKRLRFYARSTARIGKICISDSFDNGVTWTHARPIDLPNPNSGIDALALRDGRIVVVYNHSDRQRTPLNLAVSGDGEHFRMFYTLEDGPGEYSYPAVIQGNDGDLHITYTYQRKMIRYVRFQLSEIPE
jgi:predicted neuraminidase